MKDYLDNELNIGDNIIAVVSHGKNSGASFSKGTIVGFTNCFVKAIIPDYTGYISTITPITKISPDKVIKQVL